MARGAAVASAYYGREDEPILDGEGFFDTGDIATLDPSGFMQITDRAKDVIKSGGEWISSVEIEGLVAADPRVELCAVIGMPHPKWDERPLLAVKLRPGAEATPAEMLATLDGRIAKWWTPDEVVFVDDIPLGATGKVDKKLIRARFAGHVLATAAAEAETAEPAHKTSPLDRVRTIRAYAANGSLVLAIVAAFLLGFAGFGVHEEMFDLDYAVTVLATGWAPALALVAGVVGAIGFFAAVLIPPRRDRIASLLAVALAAVTYAGASAVRAQELSNPPIHDVATEWGDPLLLGPTMMARRGPDANPVDPDPKVQPQPQNPNLTGTRIADVNARTCAGAVPVILIGTTAEAYDRAHAAVMRDRLAIVTENPADGRIEAAAVSHWLKLKGDVVVRVKAEGAGARVDIRSISRTGIRDLGENCRRVTRLRAMIAK